MRPNHPKDNPYTPEKAALGKKLYFDTRISVSSAQSCGSCHSPSFGWGDGLAVGVGHGMQKLGRHSPTIINAAWGDIFMWDGRLATLEEQALGPIQSAGEMNMPLEQLMKRLESIPEYKPIFVRVFPEEGMTAKTLAKAVATYERMVVSERAPFDAWIEGDQKAISEEAKRGFAVFNGKAQCAACHEGWNFTNDGFQDIGLPGDDIGRGKFVPGVIKMEHACKTPGLREIARRAPYMHDGSLATLEQVVEHYDHGGVDRPSRSDLMRPLGLTVQERTDLVAFLRSLTSNLAPTAAPVLLAAKLNSVAVRDRNRISNACCPTWSNHGSALTGRRQEPSLNHSSRTIVEGHRICQVGRRGLSRRSAVRNAPVAAIAGKCQLCAAKGISISAQQVPQHQIPCVTP